MTRPGDEKLQLLAIPLNILDGFDIHRFAVNFDLGFFHVLRVFALDPQTGFGSQVHALELRCFERIDKKSVELGPVYFDIQMVTDGGDFNFDGSGLYADFF